jgi:RNA polymerase sigma-70 factor (ECF subfamily)
MFDKDKIFYGNEDYTVRMEKIDGCERYYLKLHGVTDSQEDEVSLDVFMLYYKEFNKPFEIQRNEYKRHIENGDIDGFVILGKLTIMPFEDKSNIKMDLEILLKTCTFIQQRRFELHYIQGYSFTEIAKMENCDESTIRRSISAVFKKIKNIF